MATKSDALGRAMRVAATQHGAVSTRQLRSIGVTARDQRYAIASGLFQLAAPTVIVVAGSADTWYRRLRVGLLHLGDDACVSHEAAAGLLGLDRTNPEALEFTVLRARRSATVPGATVHTTPKYGRADVITVEGFRCTSATRTVIDLAASGAPENRLAAAIDSSVRFRLSAPLVLEERLGQVRGRGKRGVRVLDQLLIDTGGETMLERKFLKLIREAGIPRPITQRRIKRDGEHVARVDFLYAGQRMVIEVSGRLGHTTPAERDKDAQRRNELQDLGYAVYEYTWAHVTRRPGYVVTTLRERLLLRSA